MAVHQQRVYEKFVKDANTWSKSTFDANVQRRRDGLSIWDWLGPRRTHLACTVVFGEYEDWLVEYHQRSAFSLIADLWYCIKGIS